MQADPRAQAPPREFGKLDDRRLSMAGKLTDQPGDSQSKLRPNS
jgi:hypothetical protein